MTLVPSEDEQRKQRSERNRKRREAYARKKAEERERLEGYLRISSGTATDEDLRIKAEFDARVREAQRQLKMLADRTAQPKAHSLPPKELPPNALPAWPRPPLTAGEKVNLGLGALIVPTLFVALVGAVIWVPFALIYLPLGLAVLVGEWICVAVYVLRSR